ncbi:MAG: PorV/PorQ family protein [Elusimicrobia bacterium]|nr:PorV/PorQ family protein [Elusimicrobiota bacterium]
MKQALSVIISLLVFAGTARAGASGKTAAPFLKAGFGARPAGMGDAFTGLADDINAVAWNPAGLNNIWDWEELYSRAQWFDGLTMDSAAFGRKIGSRRSLGAAALRMATESIDKTDRYGNALGSYDAYGLVGLLTYAEKITERTSTGLNVKYIRQGIAGETAERLAADVGGITRFSNLRAGAVVQNIGAKMKFRRTGDPLPLTVRLGAAYHYHRSLVLTLDVNRPSDNATSVHLGGEYLFRSMALRAGYQTNRARPLDSMAGLTAGFGVHHQRWGLDYAWLPSGLLGDTHRVSLTRKFKKLARSR